MITNDHRNHDKTRRWKAVTIWMAITPYDPDIPREKLTARPAIKDAIRAQSCIAASRIAATG